MVSSEQILLKERMNKLLKSKNYNVTKLAEGNVNLRVRLGRQFNNPNVEVQFDTLFMLLYMFHDINARWLLLGEGFMKTADENATRIYTTKNSNTVNQSDCKDSPVTFGRDSVQVIRNREIETREQIIAQQAKQIEQLERDKAFLQGMLQSLTPPRK